MLLPSDFLLVVVWIPYSPPHRRPPHPPLHQYQIQSQKQHQQKQIQQHILVWIPYSPLRPAAAQLMVHHYNQKQHPQTTIQQQKVHQNHYQTIAGQIAL